LVNRKRFHVGVAVAIVAAILGSGLVAATGAGATSPTRQPREVIPYEFSVDCGPYGFPFANEVSGQETRRTITFADSDGNPVRQVLHDSFKETDTNSLTGKAVRGTGRLTETLDLLTGTRTVVGKPFVMTEPGSGAVIHDAGRVVFDAPFHISFEAGRHDVLSGDVDQLACSALADP
jgi:hypothetical protein